MRVRKTYWHNQMEEKELLCCTLNMQFRRWRKINKWIDRILLSVLVFLLIFAGTGLIDSLMFLGEGIGGVRYRGFSELLAINPDTVAWLTMDGTHIDYPVVRSTDNFDYLDKSFEGRFYAGGTLFMDKNNSSPEDTYCIIHGHHMAAGVMFGDLSRYLDPDFFGSNSTGTLLTADYDYDILVFASGIFDAYDQNVYMPGNDIPLEYIKEHAINLRDGVDTDHILMLSTCYDDMTDRRTAVFCALVNKRKHR